MAKLTSEQKDLLICRLRAHVTSLMKENSARKEEVQSLQKALKKAKTQYPPIAYFMFDKDGNMIDLEGIRD